MSCHNRDRRARCRSGEVPSLPEVVARLRKLGRGDCDLCGGPPQFVAFFTPDAAAQRLVRAPADKVRIIPNLVCDRCASEPGWMQRLEDQILGPFRAAAGHPTFN